MLEVIGSEPSTKSKKKAKATLKCKICDQLFTRKLLYSKHMRSAHMFIQWTRDEYKCHLCEKVLVSKANLDRHIKHHESKLQSRTCNQMKFLSILVLAYPSFPNCDAEGCPETFHLFTSYIQHRQKDHRDLPAPFQCSKCDKVLSTQQGLQTHENFHESMTVYIAH